jgi:glyoxylase-like metal-dependent hydrolase (beta-lactamase superfamily II)
VDHYGLAADLVGDSKARVLSHSWNIPSLGDQDADRERRTAFYARLLEQAAVPREVVGVVSGATRGMRRFARPVTVTASLAEADVLHFAGHDWQILHTPGHTAGLICLFEPQSRTLLSSDHLLADISSNPVVEPPPPGGAERPKSLALYIASLQRVAALDVSQALPSHGPAIHDVPGLVTQRLAFHQRRENQVLAAVQSGARTTWAITQALFPNLSPLDTFLAVSEVIGHLDLLETKERILGEQVDGVISWMVAGGSPSV